MILLDEAKEIGFTNQKMYWAFFIKVPLLRKLSLFLWQMNLRVSYVALRGYNSLWFCSDSVMASIYSGAMTALADPILDGYQ